MAGEAEAAARELAEQHGLRYIDLTRTVFSPGAASMLPEDVARRFRAVPVEKRRGSTVIALADPSDPLVMDAVRSGVGGEFVPVVAPSDQVGAAISRLYGSGPLRTRSQPASADDGVIEAASPADPYPVEAKGNGHGNGHGNGNGTLAQFATADALLSTAISGDEDHGATLEDALREILVAPVRTADGASPPDGTASPDDAPPDATTPGGDPAAEASAGGAGGSAVPSTNGNGNGNGTAVTTPPATPPAVVVTVGGAPPPPPQGFGQVAQDAADVQWPPLARVLVASGRISHEEMVKALVAHRQTGESLARYLFNNGMATEDDLVRAMAEEVGLEFVDLGTYPIDTNATGLIPNAVARRHSVLALRVDNGVPVVAMANPTDVFAMDDLRTIMGRSFTPVVATRSQIAQHLRQLSEADTDVEGAAQQAAGTVSAGANPAFELESLQSVVEDAPVVRYVNLLILQALNERASDIHIEPTPRRLRIRFRIDGVMHDASSASPAIHPAVVSRLKVLGDMDITEHRMPQEGRVSVTVGDRQIDLRIATLPSLYGETVVMRLLDKTASIRRLSDLGFLPDTLERYAQTYNHPYGVILVTGPTGAGKTTTLYATLQEVMNKEKSVVTVEDPVEYQIDGITQVQINNKAGLQFGTALRAILRADPDIVLVGEIRDIETATIAMEAALSGHLVLSTLHTNTAASTPLRLTEMGIEPFLVTSAVGGVLTQRLARVLCERCKTAYDASLADFYAAGYREVDLEGLDVSTLYRATGCRTCGHTGYYGRMVLAEVMPITEDIERMIIEQQSIVSMERAAVEQGMRTLRQDGLLKALSGRTTLEEVLRVVV